MNSVTVHFGSVDVTPNEALPLAGYQRQTRASTGIDLPLEVNYVMLPLDGQRWALVLSVDTLFSGPHLAGRLASTLVDDGIDSVQEVISVASHTHYAPGLDPTKPRLGEFCERYLDDVVRRVALDVARTIREVDPVDVSFGMQSATCDLNVSRRRFGWGLDGPNRRPRRATRLRPNKDVPVHHELDALSLRAGDDLVALIWTWPCHPVNQPDGRKVGSDFPGAVRDTIRAELGKPNLPVLYLPGFAGDLRANFPALVADYRKALITPFVQHFADNDAERFDRLSVGVADAVLNALGSPAREVGGDHMFAVDRCRVSLSDLMSGGDAAERDLEIVHLQTEGLRLLLLSAEVCQPYYDILDVIGENTLMSGYLGDCYGYLPSDDQVAEGGYEVDGFREPFSVDARYREHVQARVRAAVQSLCSS